MRKLYKINRFCNYCGEYEFNCINPEYGNILVDEDGWFEGYISKKHYSHPERMIFGILHDKKVVKMYSISLVEGHEPTISDGINDLYSTEDRENNYLEGPLHILTINGTEELGASRIDAIESNEEITQELREKFDVIIKKLSKNNLYNSMYSRRKKLSNEILLAYQKYIEKRKKQLIKNKR